MMNIIGEYSVKYNIYTMFDVYTVEIKNHNLITDVGYDFFMKKWYSEDDSYPVVLGYYHDNKFYKKYNVDDTYESDLSANGTYSKTTNYIDKNTNKQYRFDGENFVGFNERLEKICIGRCNYSDITTPSESDLDLYYSYSPPREYNIDDFESNHTELIMKYEISSDELNGSTEIGVKTNHGRLVSHDVHAPYNLPVGSNVVLEYVFKLR